MSATMATVRGSFEIQAGAIAEDYLTFRKQKVFSNLKPFVVRVLCKDPTGAIINRFTAFRTSTLSNHFVTSGHIMNKTPVSIEIEYENGEKVQVIVKEASLDPDLAVLTVADSTKLPNIPSDLVGGVISCFGDEVFVLACKALSADFSFIFSEGLVSGRAFNAMELTITAYSDHGFSGAPVVNGRSQIVGVVAGTECQKTNLVRIVSAERLNDFLRYKGFPGIQHTTC